MRSRLTALILALILGIIATIGVGIYLNMLVAATKLGAERINVYTASKSISAGKSTNELVNEGLVQKTAIPRRFVASDAVTSLKQISGKILMAPLSKGEQLTQVKFKVLKGVEMLPLQLKKDQLAVSIPVDQFSGVAGQLKSGDRIIVVGTFKGPVENADFSMILLTNVPVLAAPKEQKAGQATGGAPGKQSLTIAVPVAELEKLVFAAEKGKIWVALQSERSKETSETPGADLGKIMSQPAP